MLGLAAVGCVLLVVALGNSDPVAVAESEVDGADALDRSPPEVLLEGLHGVRAERKEALDSKLPPVAWVLDPATVDPQPLSLRDSGQHSLDRDGHRPVGQLEASDGEPALRVAEDDVSEAPLDRDFFVVGGLGHACGV